MCIFCEIAQGSREALLVRRTGHTVSFLDHRPLFPGHVLVIPVEHHETIEDLPPDLLQPLFSEVRSTAAAVRSALDAHGTFVAMNNTVSQSVPHLHAHVVPRRFKDGLRGFFWPRVGYEDDEHARGVRDAIARALGASSE